MRRVLSSFVFLPLVGSCGEPPTPPEPPEPPYNGTAAGAPITVKIGPAGGIAASPDGAFSVNFPAGAVSRETDIVIRPLVSTAPISFGKAYRVEPENLSLAQPVTITLQADESSLGEFGADGVGLGYRRANGDWYGDVRSEGVAEPAASAGPAASRGAARVVRVVRPKSRFEREYAIIAFWRLDPQAANVPVGDFEILQALACLREDDPGLDADLVAQPICKASIREATWRVNGVVNGNSSVGTTAGGLGASTDYLAPNKVPPGNPVRVTVSLFWREKGLTKTFRDPILLTIVCPDHKGPAPVRAAALAPDCNGGPWVGRSSVEVDAGADGSPGTLSTASGLTWEPDSSSTGTAAIYRPRGTVKFEFTDGCHSVSPNSVTIDSDNTTASLSVLFHGDSITYSGQGGSQWTADVTDTCKGGDPRQIQVGALWFIGGGTSHDSRTIADSKTAGAIHSTYDFRREADCGCNGSPRTAPPKRSEAAEQRSRALPKLGAHR